MSLYDNLDVSSARFTSTPPIGKIRRVRASPTGPTQGQQSLGISASGLACVGTQALFSKVEFSLNSRGLEAISPPDVHCDGMTRPVYLR